MWSTDGAFLARLSDGSVIAWGAAGIGADISDVKAQLEGGIEDVWSTGYAFLARLSDGSVIAWGNADWGGAISMAVKAQLERCI